MHVVVWDPSGEYWEGAIVEDEDARVLRSRKVATLPCEPRLFRRHAVAGYFRRSWGSGWPLGAVLPRMTCPMVLQVASNDALEQVNAAVRLVPASDGLLESILARFEEGKGLVGELLLSADTGQPGASAAGFLQTAASLVSIPKLGKPDEDGGWTVYAGGRIPAGASGQLAMGLYGSVPGLAVAWAAVSLSR